MLFIFDLDGTTINSAHRHGDGTLADWQKNATDKNVANDSLLPLATGWKQIDRKHHTIVVMTARVMGWADHKFLSDNGLFPDYLYSRATGDTTPDDILKKRMIRKLQRDMGTSLAWIRANSYFFDDNKMVRDIMTRYGIKAYNPIYYNARNA
tara:strand:+ start:575 stop:1030 length:456 start_codon:yes stop_codon:yes gene_type:complete